MDINKEKLLYLLDHCEIDLIIWDLINNVLNDSETDPHYSAVAVTNIIKCYIELMDELDEKLPYNNVEEFFDFNAYTEDEYKIFEEIRRKESKYYRGIQY